MQQMIQASNKSLLIRTSQSIQDQLKDKIIQLESQLKNLVDTSFKSSRICIPTAEGYEFIEAADIIRCESDGNYTRIFIQGRTSLYVSKTLKQIGGNLPSNSFYRVHKSHIINLNRIIKIFKNNGASIQLDNKDIVPISRNRKESFFELIFK